MLKEQGSVFDGFVWAPSVYGLQGRLENLSLKGLKFEKLNPDVEGLKKPTWFSPNEFIAPFQLVTDTYGIPSYKEMNPAVFSAVSFPFLFGVMFGDIFHGTLLTIFSLYLIFSSSNFAKGFSSLKYFFLLMGLNAFFCGLIYNDFSSVALKVWGGSCYNRIDDVHHVATKKDEDCVYPFGLDPIWYQSKDEINFTNSFKMKVAVILGVAQMLLGTFMKGANAFYHRHMVEFVFVFIT